MIHKDNPEYIAYRLKKANDALDDANLLARNGRWNSAVNRLYYSCFYAVTALLLKNNIKVRTHEGARTQFSLKFVKSNEIDKKYGKLFTKLFDFRLKSDYGDMFDFDKDSVESLFPQVEEFLQIIKNKFDY